MIDLNSSLIDFINNPLFYGLKPHTRIALLFLLTKVDENRKIKKFSIRKQAKEWEELSHWSLTSNKDTVSAIIKELVKAKIIKVNFNSKVLEIL